MRGYNIVERGHIVHILPAIDISGGKSCDIFSMAKYSQAQILISIGVSAAAFTSIVVNECTALAGTNRTAIAFDYYAEETAAGDTLAARAAATSSGITPNAADTIMYILDIDAAQLTPTYHFVEVVLANGTNSVIASAMAVLSGARYAEDASPTVIA